MKGAGRTYVVAWHRYAGLAMAGFLVVAALSGAVLAFREPLDRWLAPHLFVAQSPPDAPLLDPFVLRERVQAQVAPKGRVDAVVFSLRAGATVRFPVAPNPLPDGTMAVLDFDEVYADPHSGKIQGRRMREGLGLGAEQIMPSLFAIHHSLALPGIWGKLLLGIVSLCWTLDCFAGAYLTLPRSRPFLGKWRPAWMIKWQAGSHRVTLDLHRAAGLWCWGALLLFAWSSVMFNLREPVYRPVMGVFLPFDDSWRSVPLRAQPVRVPALDWRSARAAAQEAMREQAAWEGFQVLAEERLQLDRRRGVYAYLVLSTADIRRDQGNTAVLVDADRGEYRGRWLPQAGPAGNVFSNWIGALHMGHVMGLPYRVFVALIGLAVALLSVTGVLLWWKKYCARRIARHRAPRGAPSLPGLSRD